MNTLVFRSLTIAIALLGSAILTPQLANAQCNVAGTFVASGMGAFQVRKTLTSAPGCSVTASMNVVDCGGVTFVRSPGSVNCPTGGGNCLALLAQLDVQSLTPAPRSCMFNCPCGNVTIDNSDGLPVELLSFGID